MMYYDRRVPEELAALLVGGGQLAWLKPFVDADWGRDNLAHIQFRRNQGALRTAASKSTSGAPRLSAPQRGAANMFE